MEALLYLFPLIPLFRCDLNIRIQLFQQEIRIVAHKKIPVGEKLRRRKNPVEMKQIESQIGYLLCRFKNIK